MQAPFCFLLRINILVYLAAAIRSQLQIMSSSIRVIREIDFLIRVSILPNHLPSTLQKRQW